MNNKKGIATLWLVLLIVGIVAVVGVGIGSLVYLATLPPDVVVEYDGEFDDIFLATKGDFYSDFTEGTDCNITSDVLGGSGYTTCIYDTSTEIGGGSTTNSTEFRIDLVVDIDNDIEDCEFEGNLQNTGTGQAKDDIVIKEVNLQTYEDVPTIVFDGFTIDNEDGEFTGNTGVLEGEEYVLHILLRTKLVTPAFVDGDDIMKIELDLTTDGDVDAARITLEE